MKIYKYPLTLQREQSIYLHPQAKILDAQFQDGSLQLWALVSTNDIQDAVPTRVLVLTTGEETDRIELSWMKHLSTVFQDGPLVFHIFVPKER